MSMRAARNRRGRAPTGTVDELTFIVEAAGLGDDHATRELVSLTQGRVRRLCASLGSCDDVDDLVQETYLRAFRSLPCYRGEAGAIIVWLLAIARNVCADQVRRRARQRALVERLAVGRARSAPAPDAQTALEDLVAHLPADMRDAFVLTQVLGLSYEDAAEVCGCPVGTIRSRVSRARSSLLGSVRAAEA
jgi:RNA polymerase sigma-70 factor (ECF subfamily)